MSGYIRIAEKVKWERKTEGNVVYDTMHTKIDSKKHIWIDIFEST